MKDFTFQLQANTPYDLHFKGTSYHVQEATDPVKLSFDNGESVVRERTQGAKISQYQYVRVESKVAQLVTIVLGDGLILDGRTELSDQTVNVDVAVSGGVFEREDVVVTSGAPVLLVPSNDAREVLLLSVSSNQNSSIRVGSANVSATAGQIIEEGSTLTLRNRGAIYGISMGVDVSVTVLEEGDF